MNMKERRTLNAGVFLYGGRQKLCRDLKIDEPLLSRVLNGRVDRPEILGKIVKLIKTKTGG
jgi:hypothetical protein